MSDTSRAGELVSSVSTLLFFWIHKLLIQLFPLSTSGLECALCSLLRCLWLGWDDSFQRKAKWEMPLKYGKTTADSRTFAKPLG